MAAGGAGTVRVDVEEVQRAVWVGEIPVVFNIGAGEVSGTGHIDALWLLCPRMSWLSIVRPKVHAFFAPHGPPGHKEKDLWFEYRGLPLKWHLPLGVQFDYLCPDQHLPFPITVRFTNYPSSADLVRADMEEDIRWLFTNARKQAELLKRGSTKALMCLSRNDSNAQWEGVLKREFVLFSRVCKQLQAAGKAPVKAVPCRILERRPPASEFERPPPPSFIQMPIEPVLPNGEDTLFGDAVAMCLATRHAVEARVGDSSEPEEAQKQERPREDFALVVQGVSPRLDTPLAWLAETACHPDGWLYVVVAYRNP